MTLAALNPFSTLKSTPTDLSLLDKAKSLSLLNKAITTIAIAALSYLASHVVPLVHAYALSFIPIAAIWVVFGACIYAYGSALINRLHSLESFYSPIEKIEVECFNWINSHLNIVNTIISNVSSEQAANGIVSNYIYSEKAEMSDEERQLLVKTVQFQLDQPRGSLSQGFDLGNGKRLVTFKTKADGSCGFHALLGERINDEYVCPQVQKARSEFCDWLKGRALSRNLPEMIYGVLDDYYHNPKIAPSSFRKAVSGVHKEILRSLGLTESEENERNFIYNPIVIDAYLNNLREVGTYLSQHELMAAAEYFKINVFLYQPGWWRDANRVTCSHPDLFPDADTIFIWYNPTRQHYERAALAPSN